MGQPKEFKMPKGKILMGKRPVKPGPVKPTPKGGEKQPGSGGNYENNLNTSPKKLKDLAKKAGKILPVDKKYASDTNNKMKAAAGPKTKPVMPRRAGK